MKHKLRFSLALLVIAIGQIAHAQVANVADIEKFDLREVVVDGTTHNYMTSVKNQNPFGLCWSFASIASIESNMLMQGLADRSTLDLSEWYNGTWANARANSADNPNVANWGGWWHLTSFALASGLGPVNETEANSTFPGYTGDRTKPAIDTQQNGVFVNKVVNYYGTSSWYDGMSFKNKIKQTIMTHGAMYTSIRQESDSKYYYTGSNGGTVYYMSDTDAGDNPRNHAVTLAGWDDNKTITVNGVEKKGAWLIKNSYGTGYKDDGYFWVSYDHALGVNSATSFQMQATNPYKTIQSAGKPGEVMGIWYHKFDNNVYKTEWVATEMVSDGNAIKALGIWALQAGYDVEIKIFTSEQDFRNNENQIAHVIKSDASTEGFQIIELEDCILLEDGQEYIVAYSINDEYYALRNEFMFPVYEEGELDDQRHIVFSENADGTFDIDGATDLRQLLDEGNPGNADSVTLGYNEGDIGVGLTVYTVDPADVPEPATLLLLTGGAVVLIRKRRRAGKIAA